MATALVTVLVVCGIGWVNRAELPVAAAALRGADARWLLAGSGMLGLWWASWVLLYASCRRLLGVDGYRQCGQLVAVVLGSVAVNLVVKSSGLAGLTLFLRDARQRNLPVARVSVGYVLAACMAEGAFAVTLAAGTGLVLASGAMDRVELVAVAAFVGLLGVRAGLAGALLRSRAAFVGVCSAPARWRDRLLRRPARAYGVGAGELYDAVLLLRRQPAGALAPFGFALCVDVFGVALLCAALAAVGGGVRPGVALVAYAISAVFGTVGFMPGGLGFVEVSSAALLASSGVPLGVAAAAVVVFRAWDFWLPLAVGAAAVWWLHQDLPVGQAAVRRMPGE
ncbi:lysylphosphatidylglycerol synthase domain-containing protein [Dactylosporangium sp. NPDC049525]|uniref:lysylphosphatidylglycerol synthase transmembrane domain-containing protein n=1 Tax=Dactylosporangium sp. NPDC049525 TaxID=3154730 RepID=UPI003421F617